MADIDPAATLRCAAELAPKVLPAAIAELVAGEIRFRDSEALAAEVLALAEQQQARPFKVGDEVRWKWHEDGGSGKWFKARLVEHRPAGYPKGWAGAITDQGTFYAGDYTWQCPVGYIVFLDEPSMTLVTEGGQ